MTHGEIILVPFPFTDLTDRKVRPAVVVCETHDKYHDVLICAISSVIPRKMGAFEMLLRSSPLNNLRADSVVKIDRLATVKRTSVIAKLGRLTDDEVRTFDTLFKKLTD